MALVVKQTLSKTILKLSMSDVIQEVLPIQSDAFVISTLYTIKFKLLHDLCSFSTLFYVVVKHFYLMLCWMRRSKMACYLIIDH